MQWERACQAPWGLHMHPTLIMMPAVSASLGTRQQHRSAPLIGWDEVVHEHVQCITPCVEGRVVGENGDVGGA